MHASVAHQYPALPYLILSEQLPEAQANVLAPLIRVKHDAYGFPRDSHPMINAFLIACLPALFYSPASTATVQRLSRLRYPFGNGLAPAEHFLHVPPQPKLTAPALLARHSTTVTTDPKDCSAFHYWGNVRVRALNSIDTQLFSLSQDNPLTCHYINSI